jgi:hypothetical protein
VQSLLNGLLGVERESSVDLSGDLSRDDLEDLLAELDEETVERRVDLVVDVCAAVLLAVCDGDVGELGVLLLLRGGEDQGWVGGGILRLILANSCRGQNRNSGCRGCSNCGI